MNKKQLGIILLVSGLFLSSLSYLGIDLALRSENNTNSNTSTVEVESQFTNYFGHEYIEKVTKSYTGYNTEVATNELYGISGYTTNNHEIEFESVSSSKIQETIYSNGKDVASKYYFNSDMVLDTVVYQGNIIDYAFDDNNNLSSIIINDTTFTCEYDTYNRVTATYVDDNLEHKYEYNALGYLVNEEDYKNEKYSYTYSDSFLEDIKDIDYSVINNSIKYNYNNLEYEYKFDYEYNSKRYCTSIIENGVTVYEMSYLNDKVTSLNTNGFEVNYILDSNLNYIGFNMNDKYYYFINDFFGNVYAIMDENGSPVVYYNHQAYGLFECTGIMSSNLGIFNIILDNKYITDPITNVKIKAGEIIFPHERKKVNLNNNLTNLKFEDSLYYQNINLEIDEVGVHSAVKGKVMTNIQGNFNDEGMDVALNVPVLDNNKEYIDNIDIYIVDYMYASDSFNNLLNGGQIYNVVYRDASEDIVDLEIDNVKSIISNKYKLDYYQEVNPILGTLVFEGQFIYFDRLVKYNCTGEGVVYYHFEENKTENYSPYINLYDYDNLKYVNYVNDTFDINYWDYVEIIPGLNQERYEVLAGYIDDAVKVSSQITQENVAYFDENYFNSLIESENGDTLAAFDDISVDDMVVMSSDGDFVIKEIPWNESRTFRNALYKIGGTVVILTIATVIAVVAPPCQFLIPVVSAAWSGVFGAVAFATLTPAITLGIDLADGDVDMNLNAFLKETARSIGNGVLTGAITGAIFGSLKLVKNAVLNKSINRKIAALDDIYTPFVKEDSYAAMHEYENLVATIKTGKSTLLNRYLNSSADLQIVKIYLSSNINRSLVR